MAESIDPVVAGDSKHQYHIAALAKGLAVLSAFNEDRFELTLRDIAEAAGVTQPSALRIAHTLVEAEFMVRNPATKGYRLGAQAVSVGLATLGAMTLPQICEPYLHRLRDQTDATIKLGVPLGDDAVVVAMHNSRRYPRSSRVIGSGMPIHVGSLGRAILAWLPEPQVERILGDPGLPDWQSRMAKTFTPQQLARELAATRRRGYSLNDQDVTGERRSAGAPLLAPSGIVVGSINLAIPARRCSLETMKREFAPLIVQTARQVSATLPPQAHGGRAPDGEYPV